MFAQQSVNNLTSGLNRGPMQAMLAAIGTQDEQGRFTGGVDLSKIRGKGLDELSAIGNQALSTGAGRQSFAARSKDITQGLQQQEDFVPAIMEMIQKQSGGDKDKATLLAKQLLREGIQIRP